MIRTSNIKNNPNNPRTINDDKLEKLKRSIKSFPEMMEKRPMICVTDVDGKLYPLGGNMRLKAIKELGMKEIPKTWVAMADEWTEEQRKEFIIKDNANLGDWNLEDLQENWDLDLISEWGVDLDIDEVEELEAEEDDFDVELPEDPKTVLGDLYEIGEHRLLCGDSTDSDQVAKLMNGEKADMVFTDPPYGVSFVGIKGSMYLNGKTKGKDSNEQIKGDELRGDEISEIFEASLANGYLYTTVNAPFYIFFAINKSEETLKGISNLGLEIRNWLIWDKGNVGFHAMGAQYKPNYESFLYCFKKGSPPNWIGNQQQQTIWRHSLERLGLHPTMKPISLISQAIQNHDALLLLDLFLGSGSTMVASHQLKRKCYGLELDPKYCDVIINRMIKLDPDLRIKRNGVDITNEWN